MANRILHSTLMKILIGLTVCGIAVAIAQTLAQKITIACNLSTTTQNVIIGLSGTVAMLLSYIAIYTRYEKRQISELSLKTLLSNIAAGALLGVVLQSLVIITMFFTNAYTVISVNSFISTLPFLIISINAGVMEELMFRGIIFRLSEEKLGSYYALLISGILFGAAHLANANSSLMAGLAIAIEAGVLLGVAYMLTRSLWLPIGIHFAWNYTQSGIYGASTSGHPVANNLITSRIQGNTLLTGGAFGPEASLPAIFFCLSAAVILFVFCKQNGKIASPFWKKKSVAFS